MVKCVICNKEFEQEKQLHAHLKAHKMRMAEYYQTYFPRKDFFAGEIKNIYSCHKKNNSGR